MQFTQPISLVFCLFWKEVPWVPLYHTAGNPLTHSPPFTSTKAAVLLLISFTYISWVFLGWLGPVAIKKKKKEKGSKTRNLIHTLTEVQKPRFRKSFSLSCFLFLLLNPLSLFFLLRPPTAFVLLAMDTEFQMRISPPQLMHRLARAISLFRSFQHHPIVHWTPSPDNQLQEMVTQLAPILPSNLSAPPIRPHALSPTNSEHLPARQGLAHHCVPTSAMVPGKHPINRGVNHCPHTRQNALLSPLSLVTPLSPHTWQAAWSSQFFLLHESCASATSAFPIPHTMYSSTSFLDHYSGLRSLRTTLYRPGAPHCDFSHGRFPRANFQIFTGKTTIQRAPMSSEGLAGQYRAKRKKGTKTPRKE